MSPLKTRSIVFSRGLRDSVAKLLQDVNFKDSRPSVTPKSSRNILTENNSNVQRPARGIAEKENHSKRHFAADITSKASYYPDATRNAQSAEIRYKNMEPEITRNSQIADIRYENIEPEVTRNAFNNYKVVRNSERMEGARISRANPSFMNRNTQKSDTSSFVQNRNTERTMVSLQSKLPTRVINASVVVPSSLESVSSFGDSVGDEYAHSDVGSYISERCSTLTCDSGEFQTDLANLDADIKKLQKSLRNAKST